MAQMTSLHSVAEQRRQRVTANTGTGISEIVGKKLARAAPISALALSNYVPLPGYPGDAAEHQMILRRNQTYHLFRQAFQCSR